MTIKYQSSAGYNKTHHLYENIKYQPSRPSNTIHLAGHNKTYMPSEAIKMFQTTDAIIKLSLSVKHTNAPLIAINDTGLIFKKTHKNSAAKFLLLH